MLQRTTLIPCLLCLLLGSSICQAKESSKALPAVPDDAMLLFSIPKQTIPQGKAWLVNTQFDHRSYHMQGHTRIVFDLSNMNLKPGTYRLGFIARTGTHWSGSTNHLKHYRLHLQSPDTETIALGMPQKIAHARYKPIMDSGKEGSWANWFGSVICPSPTALTGKEKLIVENLNGHGGVVAIWAQPVTASNATTITIQTKVAKNAFISGQKPTLEIQIRSEQLMPAFKGYLRLDQFDLLSEQTQSHYMPIEIQPGKVQTLQKIYEPIAGIYRVTGSIVENKTDASSPNTSATSCLYAYAPAKLARDLPDDWPLAAHVAHHIPPLPGFRWYRYFAGWHHNNPAPGKYNWDRFDKVFKQVQQVGGKLMIADDGSPTWTSSRGKVGMGWVRDATAYPPDNWQVLSDYLTAMIKRYEDPAGTLAALELCNEANTIARWDGTDEQMIQMAKVFHQAAKTAKHPIQTLGISVSAGDHRGFVNRLIKAGILEYVDAISGHWYEEIMSFEKNTPINNLIKHVDLLKNPMKQAGYDLPMINSECGIGFVKREDGKLVSQKTINQRYRTSDKPTPSDPWLRHTKGWRQVSERRAAGTYVAGTVMLMAYNVMPTFYFSHFNFLVDDTPSLPWVAIGQLGHHLDGIDYHHIQPLESHVVGSDEKDGSPKALAYLIGKPNGKQVIIAWSFLSDTTVGRSKHWQRWLEPVPIQITTDIQVGQLSDLYGRNHAMLKNNAGKLNLHCGEEPMFITIN